MSNFSLEIAEVLQVFRGTRYRMIDFQITFIHGKFEHRAMPFTVAVSDSNVRVESFFALLSPDRKVMHGYFTTDAFTDFTGNVNVSFGYGEQPVGIIENVSISPVPLPSFLAAIGDPDATRATIG